MDQLDGLGWIPDIPSHLDYTEDHPRCLAGTQFVGHGVGPRRLWLAVLQVRLARARN